jgi:hypothetical protein
MKKILCFAILAMAGFGCAEPTFKMSVLGTVVEVTRHDEPLDYGKKEKKFDLRVAAFDEVAEASTENSVLRLGEAGDKEHSVLVSVGEQTGDVTVGSLRQLNKALRDLHVEQLQRNRVLIAMVVTGHQMQYEAFLSEERALRDRRWAEYQNALAKQSKGQAVGASGGAAAGAAIGSVVPGLGTALGALAGLAVGLFAGGAASAAPQPPELPDESDIKRIAGAKAGLGDDPEQALRAMTVGLSTQLIRAEVATLETMNASNAVIVRRALFNAEDGLVLADVAVSTYKDVVELYNTAGDIWDRNSEEWQAAADLFERSQKAWKATRNQIITTIVVSSVIETFTQGTEQTTAEYRKSLDAQGMNLKDKDIDHIIPKAKGGVDHPWNYQAVSSSLNRAWQDGHLFEKCLNNPVAFAKAITVNYPGLAGAVAGGVSFWATVGGSGDDASAKVSEP